MRWMTLKALVARFLALSVLLTVPQATAQNNPYYQNSYALVIGINQYESWRDLNYARKEFITTGDGDIQKPYTPVGQVIYSKTGNGGFLPLVKLFLPIVDPETEINTVFLQMVRNMGGDGVINVSVNWIQPSSFFTRLIGFGHNGHVQIQGTVIKR